MTEFARQRRVMVMGIGNLLLKDDGAGIHALHALQETAYLSAGVDVELVDAATTPDLSVYMDGSVDKLIIVDAVKSGGQPGTVCRFTPDVLESESNEVASVHNLTVRESLGLMLIAGTLPTEIVIIGVEPADMEWGATLSAEVAARIGELVAAIHHEIIS